MVFITMAELTAAISMWALKKAWHGISYMIWGPQVTPEQIEIRQLKQSIEEIKRLQKERLEIENSLLEKVKQKEKQSDTEKKRLEEIEKREQEIDDMHQSFRLSYMSQSCPNLKDINKQTK